MRVVNSVLFIHVSRFDFLFTEIKFISLSKKKKICTLFGLCHGQLVCIVTQFYIMIHEVKDVNQIFNGIKILYSLRDL